MGNSTKVISILMVVLSILIFASQNRASGFRDDDHLNTTLTCHSQVSPDSCNLMTYVYDDSMAYNGYTFGADGLIQMGNFFPIADYTSGVIKSIDMCFSTDSSVITTTAQSCIVYFYKSDQTTIFGQSDPFINTGASWPACNWVNVLCPDIPYTGPFYAMVDYTIQELMPRKNFFDYDNNVIPGFYYGLGFINDNGVWHHMEFFNPYDPPSEIFLQRVNVCENDVVGIKELSPGSISLYPNPANDIVNIVSTTDIRTIEVLNYIGQTIYKTNDINLKVIKLDVGSFNAGEYFVKITTMSGIETTKVTVIH
jgi:hypothetical protein